MNAEQVLRDMRVCFTEGECNNCSRIDDEDCVDGLCKDIIDLIESLQADNAELRKANSEYQDAQHPLFMALCDAQRREKAAVEDLQAFVEHPCSVCIHLQDQQFCYKNCQDHDRENHRAWQWRGPSDREAHHDA